MSFKRHKNTQRLKEITTLAKKIRKGTKKKWQTAVKEAAKKLHPKK